MFKFPTKASLDSYIAGTTPKSGIHIVEVDETHYNEKIEYVYKNSILTRLSNPKIEFIKRDNVNTFAEVASITSPINKNMVVVLKDETTFSKTTWYTYNVSQWVLMGEYLGSKIEKVVSIDGERTAVIHENTNFTIPGTLKYTVGRNELSIYVGGIKLTSTDFIEIGTTGVLSNIVQFTSAILTGMEIEFIREVHNNVTTDPSYQIVQQKIQDDTILSTRIEFLKYLGHTYGGTIQECKLPDYSKIYWCNINKKYYKPKFKNIIPTMTANTVGSVVASASSEHSAPFSAYMAFDKNDDTFWHNTVNGQPISTSNKAWLKIDLGVKTPVTHMLLAPRKSYTTQAPKVYILEGSDDNNIWTTILNATNNAMFKAGSLVENEDILPVTAANYRYYRLTISGLYSSTGTVVSLRAMFSNLIPGSWSIADSDWVEFTVDGDQAISWTPTVNLLGNVTYLRREGKIVKTEYGYKIYVSLIYTCDNATQDGANFLIKGLPIFLTGFTTGAACTENVYLTGALVGTGAFLTLDAPYPARNNELMLIAQNVDNSNKKTQYIQCSRSCFKGSQTYIYATLDVMYD